MYNEDKKTLTLARRTRKNLDFIYRQKEAGADVEEFTHLLNSMLGMLICLREEYFKGRSVPWKDVEEMGLEPLDITSYSKSQARPNLKPHSSFSQLIAKIRHAFAHNCFELIAGGVNFIL